MKQLRLFLVPSFLVTALDAKQHHSTHSHHHHHRFYLSFSFVIHPVEWLEFEFAHCITVFPFISDSALTMHSKKEHISTRRVSRSVSRSNSHMPRVSEAHSIQDDPWDEGSFEVSSQKKPSILSMEALWMLTVNAVL